MKNTVTKYLATVLIGLIVLSCAKVPQPSPEPEQAPVTEKHDQTQEPKYERPVEETILLAAAEQKAEINGFHEEDETVSVDFVEPYTFSGEDFASVTIKKSFVNDVKKSTTAVVFTFKDEVSAKLEFQKEVSLDIDTELEYYGFMHDSVEIPFKVTKLGNGDIRLSVNGENGFEPRIDYNQETKEGTITFQYNEQPGVTDMASVILTDGESSTEYTIKATTYHFSVEAEDIALEGEEGSKAPLDLKIDTDIPDCVLEYELEGDFFTLSDGVVTTVSENRTEKPRNGQISIFENRRVFPPISINIVQNSLPALPPENCIVFEDLNFKNAMLEISDTNKDGQVSYDEALTVKEIIAVDKGIKNLTGLEYFKNAWKADFKDNDIENATVLKEVPQLYWLDLKGNKNLKTFDVTTCSQYFEHCAFEVSEDLVYYAFRSQYGIARESDPYLTHSPNVPDPRKTTDWTHHKNMRLIHQHTKTINTEEMPWISASQKEMVPSIVFTGLSYIDVDFNDGTWERLFKQAYEQFCQKTIIGKYIEYFDIYFLEYMVDSREKFYFDPNSYRDSEECENALKLLEEERDKLFLYAYDSLYGNTEWAITTGSKPSKQYPAQLLIKIDSQPLKETIVLNNRCCFNSTGFYTQDKYTANGREMQYKAIFSTNSRSINQAITTANIRELSIEELIGIPATDYYESFLKFARILN